MQQHLTKTQSIASTWNVYATVFNADSMNAHFFWYKSDAVLSRTYFADVTLLRNTGRTGDGSLEVTEFCV